MYELNTYQTCNKINLNIGCGYNSEKRKFCVAHADISDSDSRQSLLVLEDILSVVQ